jgi:hypothetical protein
MEEMFGYIRTGCGLRQKEGSGSEIILISTACFLKESKGRLTETQLVKRNRAKWNISLLTKAISLMVLRAYTLGDKNRL